MTSTHKEYILMSDTQSGYKRGCHHTVTKNYVLKAVRAFHDQSQEDMLDVVGLKTISAYNKKENGKVSFTQDEMQKLSNHFNMTVDALFYADEVLLKRTDNKKILNNGTD